MRTLRRTSSRGSSSSAATAAASSSGPGSTRRIAVQRSSFGSIRILEVALPASVAILRGCCKGPASSAARLVGYEARCAVAAVATSPFCTVEVMSRRPPSPTIVEAPQAPDRHPMSRLGWLRGTHLRQPRLEPREGQIALMISITKRRLASLATASAIVATMAVAAMPTVAFAAASRRAPTYVNGRFDPHGSATLNPRARAISGLSIRRGPRDDIAVYLRHRGTPGYCVTRRRDPPAAKCARRRRRWRRAVTRRPAAKIARPRRQLVTRPIGNRAARWTQRGDIAHLPTRQRR